VFLKGLIFTEILIKPLAQILSFIFLILLFVHVQHKFNWGHESILFEHIQMLKQTLSEGIWRTEESPKMLILRPKENNAERQSFYYSTVYEARISKYVQ